MTSLNSLPQGTKLKSPSYTYKIKCVLGQGTFGIAYLAEMTYRTQVEGQFVTKTKDVAVKEFFMRDINSREGTTVTNTDGSKLFMDYMAQFEQEAENLRFMVHPHIIHVYDFFKANGTVYYAMEYLPKDPAILVSSVNMLLRDEEFDTLESLCYAFNREPQEIKEYLHGHGFVWSEAQKQFRPIGYDA